MRQVGLFISILFFTVLISSCGLSESQIATAIILTQNAQPTSTTIPATSTATSTSTPLSPTSTSEPVSVFGCNFEECKEVFSDWMETRFDYVYNVGDAKVFEGTYIEIGITVYLYEIEGLLGNIMLTVVDSPLFDGNEQAMFLYKVWDYFGNQEVIEWFTENWPQSQETEIEFFIINERTMALSTNLNESGACIFIMADVEYLL
jgi:hypothetical protein